MKFDAFNRRGTKLDKGYASQKGQQRNTDTKNEHCWTRPLDIFQEHMMKTLRRKQKEIPETQGLKQKCRH